MKILILAQLVTHSGVGMYIKSLAEQLSMLNDEIHILSEKYDIELNECIKCHQFLPIAGRNLQKKL